MSPYYRYKKEKFLEKYQSAYDNLEDLKESISEYKKSNSRIIRRAMFAFFQDFSEYIVDMCESYIMVNDGKLKSTISASMLIEKSCEMGFFDEKLKGYLVMAVKLRNRYTHDYYLREDSEKLITKVEDGSELSAAFDDIKTQDYVDKYTKNRIIKAISEVVGLKEFYNKKVFTNLDEESKAIIDKGLDKYNQLDIIELNKRLLKSKLGDSVDPIENWANSNTVDVINDMKKSGIDNMWLGLDDWNTGFNKPELIQQANDLGYLIGTYDSYHSIHKPGNEKWITAKFNDTSLYEDATVTNKAGNKIEGFQGKGRKLNPTLAMPSVKERVSSIMNTGLPFNSWFLDTDGTGEVYDDYSPQHITTEKEDVKHTKVWSDFSKKIINKEIIYRV